MLNFAEQTGSGAVIVVWSFLRGPDGFLYYKVPNKHKQAKNRTGIPMASGHRDPGHKPTTEPSEAPTSTPSCYPESRQVTITPR